MRVLKILTYFEGQHGEPFHILVEDDYQLLHALEVIKNSPDVQHFEIDGCCNGAEFYDTLYKLTYPELVEK